ncbi:MAG TPA: sugar ABC transporter permease [Anaerolineales bacterium]|nr:MAG: ABC transporter [Chloroflexi bacterium RBG_19FT_COMBO_62_14]HLE05441.1 sugar ABC transporter permease [Anaerolineales bacterium]
MTTPQQTAKRQQPAGNAIARILRFGLTVLILLIAFYGLYLGFLFLREGDRPKWIMALAAIVWGVGGVALLYYLFNSLVELLPVRWTTRLQPFVFVGPGIALLIWFLALPALRTLYISLFGRNGPPSLPLTMLFAAPGEYFAALSTQFVGWNNFIAVFTDRLMLGALRNNILFWIGIATPLTVIAGLLIAVLADRSNFERAAKSIIFMPMAISFVGASVIWNFIYEVNAPGSPQIGLLNAVVVALGGQPHGWTNYTAISPWNNLFLVIIVVWLQTGFAMVLLSAAIKGIPEEILEAARVDGATEIQLFFRIMIPYLMATIIAVTTTIIIFTLKIFDVVWVMTGGQFGTDVIATQFYRQSFINRNSGFGSAIAIILLVAVTPVMVYNLRRLKDQEAFR